MNESENLTHINEKGEARMVDVGNKAPTAREAIAVSTLYCRLETLEKIDSRVIAKGDVYAAARIAGIMATKKTAELIPLCHPLSLTHCEIQLESSPSGERPSINIRSTVRTLDRTGVEMEALVGASVSALTVYDMCKAIDRGMVIGETYLAEKRGGKSGIFLHPQDRG